jgi:glycosyltransferase involved in cell wall biosynthesis
VTTVRNHLFENYAYDFGWFGRYLMAPLHLRMLRRIEKAITVSHTLSERLLKEYGFACDVVLNAVDQEIYFPAATVQKRHIRRQLGLPLEHRVFAVTGYLSALKDPVCVAEGFLKAAIPNTTMIFIGDGIIREKLVPLCKTGKILLAGRVTNVNTYLQGSDFMVSGSHTEGMPNAVLEAMACGLPCILSDINAHREIARHCPAGTKLFRVREVQSLADKIHEVLDQNYAEMSLAAVQAVTRNFSIKSMSENYLQVYTSILNEKQTLTGEHRCLE